MMVKKVSDYFVDHYSFNHQGLSQLRLKFVDGIIDLSGMQEACI